jgi:lipoyl(octanoyl) transferase
MAPAVNNANGQKGMFAILSLPWQALPVIFDEIELLVELGAPAHPAPVNMAVDEVLLKSTRRPILRVYGWQRAAVTYGYFEQWEPVAKAYPDRDRVRRWTGGGVVPHGEDWTYSLIVPRAHPFARVATAESYRVIHEILGAAMRSGGVQAQVTPQAAPKISQACFENPAQYDLLAGDHKIAGAAQRRPRHGMLHQGSVQATNIPKGLAAHLAGMLSKEVIPCTLGAEELAAAEALSASQYATEAWNRKF